MKRLEEEKKATLMDRMKMIAEKASKCQHSQFEDEIDMRVIEDEENAVVGSMDAGECSPEEYIKAHMDPNREMVEIYDEVDEKWVQVPAFETGVDDAKTEEEIVAEANNWKVTTGIIIGLVAICGGILWFCFR